MADLSDVANALVTLATGLVYPAGTTLPSVTGNLVHVYYGWPIPQQLDADLQVAICHVSVYPRPQERNTTRHLSSFAQTATSVKTLTLTVAGQAVTLAGTIPPASNPHNLAIFVNGTPFVYQASPGDTLASAAAALAALIPGATATGAVITITGTIGAVRVGVTSTTSRLIRSQERVFQIGIWADTPMNRDTIAQAVDPTLAATTFLTFADGSAGRLRYVGSPISDMAEKSTLYRRDLMYAVDYATLQSLTATDVTQTQLNVSAGVPPASSPVATEFA